MHRIAFVIDQKQDFYLSLAFVHLLKEYEQMNQQRIFQTVAFLLSERVEPEFKPYLNSFDRVETIGHCSFPTPHPILFLIEVVETLKFRRVVRNIMLDSSDVLVAYSFREFVLNVLIRELKSRPRLVSVRKCDYALEHLQTRRRLLLSFYWNLWNRLLGFSPQCYRWLPDTNRVGSGTFVRNPYDFEFCMNPVELVELHGKQIPYPFAVLRSTRSETTPAGKPTILVLGEIYPFEEGMAMEPFIRQFNIILNYIRQTFPEHRLVFKPRLSVDGLELDMHGFEIAYQDVLLESLLIQDTNIEKVISFKSSGSFVATLYGCDGYLLYPVCKLSSGFKNALDAFFEEHRGTVWLVRQLDDLCKTHHDNPAKHLGQVKQLSQPFLDVLLRVDNNQESN